jgi:hypothetical protein
VATKVRFCIISFRQDQGICRPLPLGNAPDLVEVGEQTSPWIMLCGVSVVFNDLFGLMSCERSSENGPVLRLSIDRNLCLPQSCRRVQRNAIAAFRHRFT